MTEPVLHVEDAATAIGASDGSVALSIPIRLKRRSGRRLIGARTTAVHLGTRHDDTPTPHQLALARGFRWLRMIESGEAASMSEIARLERIDPSYVARMLNLTVLAPDITAAILDETIPDSARLNDLAVSPAMLWAEQRIALK